MGVYARCLRAVLLFVFCSKSQTLQRKNYSVAVTIDSTRKEVFILTQSEIPLAAELTSIFCKSNRIESEICPSQVTDSLQLINSDGSPSTFESDFTLSEKLQAFQTNEARYSADKKYTILNAISTGCFSAEKIAMSSEDTVLFNNIFGDLLYRLGEYKGGIACFDEIVKAKPTDKSALYHLGAMREDLSRGDGKKFLVQSAEYGFFRKYTKIKTIINDHLNSNIVSFPSCCHCLIEGGNTNV